MSNVYFIGDTHFGHARAITFRTYPDGEMFKTIHEHDEFICAVWNSKITKNDLVYVCGDVAFNTEGLERFQELKGRKFLVRGNHDVFSSNRYLTFFEDIIGICKLKYSGTRYWVSHAPIHPYELRNGINIHGHVHSKTIRTKDGEIDKNYYNVSAENIGYEPRTVGELARLHNQA